MADLKNNPLLWVSIVVGAAYWFIAPALDTPLLSILMAAAVMITASVALYEYAPEAWQIVVKKKRSADSRGRGSHLAIYGFFLFSFGSVFSGGYALLWLWYGYPTDWIGSSPANFGRFCHAVGFTLMQAGPAMKREGYVLRPSWWVAAIIAAALVAIGFYLGLQFNSIEVSDVREWKRVADGRPVCPPDEPVVGSRGKVIHTDSSPFWNIVRPHDCFTDIDAAKRAGYRTLGN